jgi:hypothetical protein
LRPDCACPKAAGRKLTRAYAPRFTSYFKREDRWDLPLIDFVCLGSRLREAHRLCPKKICGPP